jgi:hypothetical protein
MILLISVFHMAGITGVSHQHLTYSYSLLSRKQTRVLGAEIRIVTHSNNTTGSLFLTSHRDTMRAICHPTCMGVHTVEKNPQNDAPEGLYREATH